MSKTMLFVLVGLLNAAAIMARATDKQTCGRHGDPCTSTSQCCSNIMCHRYANRCQVIITAEELMAQREKILGRASKGKGKN